VLFSERTITLGLSPDLDEASAYEPGSGENIGGACRKVSARALLEQRRVTMVFNDTLTHADPGDDPELVERRWAMKRAPAWRHNGI
jgi:hypothetical protein